MLILFVSVPLFRLRRRFGLPQFGGIHGPPVPVQYPITTQTRTIAPHPLYPSAKDIFLDYALFKNFIRLKRCKKNSKKMFYFHKRELNDPKKIYILSD